MIQLRIIGFIWLLLGALEFGRALYCVVRDSAGHTFTSVIWSDVIDVAFFALAALAGFGIFYRRAWARVAFGAAAVLLLFYAGSYVLMVGLGFGMTSLLSVLTVAVFAVYSILVVFKYGRAASYDGK